MKLLLFALPLSWAGQALAQLPVTQAPITRPSGDEPISTVRTASATELRVRGRLLHATPRQVDAVRWIEVPRSDVRVVAWRERAPGGDGSEHYSVSFDGERFSRVREARTTLHLQRATFDPLRGAPDFEDSPLPAGGSVYLVQYRSQTLAAYRAEIERLGGAVHHFVPFQANLVRMSPSTAEAVRALDFVRWVGSYHAEYRLEPYVLANLDTGELPDDQRYNVQVFEKGPREKAVVAERIAAIGGTVVAAIPDGYLLEARLTADQVRTAATWDEVVWIDRWFAPEPDMNIVRTDGGANLLEANTGMTGAGVRGECFDGNCDASHPDLQSNPVIFHGNHEGDASHGTPVTGIVFGDGTGNADARGLLPDGQPIFADNGQVANRYVHTGELLQPPYEAVFQTNSWGSGLTTSYTSTSMEMDDITFDFDLVVLQSQSNTGDQNSRPQAWAKNVVSVGGIVHFNSLTKDDDGWLGSGSIGPAADGRIKPDLAHWYDSIQTLDDGGGYDGFGGTSAATPISAGYFGLFFEMWHAGTLGNQPSGATVFESRPKATTARAFVINAARRYDFTGTGHDLTRVHQGWGRASVRRLWTHRHRYFWVDETEVLGNLESVAYSLVVPPEQDELRATLVYLDLPGTTSASLHRINDLTLRVTGPGGAPSYWGNRGLRQGNASMEGGSPDTKNVVENVFVPDPEPGAWTVEVFADEVNVDAHLETGAVDADFALVVNGTLGEVGACVDPIAYCDGAPNSVGNGAVFSTLGSTSVAANDLSLHVEEMPANQAGLFFYGPETQVLPLGEGTMCVGGSFKRLPAVFANAAGVLDFTLDLGNLPAGGQIQSGDTTYFQLWYRDPAGGGSGFNFSNGRQITWCD